MDNIKVLIVDDDPMVADINKSYTEAVAGFFFFLLLKMGKMQYPKLTQLILI